MNMKKNIVSLKSIKGEKTNPFMVELKGHMYLQPRANTIVAKGQEIINTETGEIVQDDVLLGRRKIVDKSQFAKIYASELGILFELSRSAINVFMYLTKVMDYENKAIFDYKKEYEELGYKSEVPSLNGLRELITKNIIYPHYINGIWWINPKLVCKGERFAKYTEYVTEERHKKDLQNAMIREQYYQKINSFDNEVQQKIDAMNKVEENKYYKKNNNK